MPIEPYQDNFESGDGAVVVRRIIEGWVQPDPAWPLGHRLKSQAFQFYDEEQANAAGCPGPGMSFTSPDVAGLSAEATINGILAGGFGAALLPATALQIEGFGVHRRPTLEDPGHVVLYRLDLTKSLPKSISKRLAATASAPGLLHLHPTWRPGAP